jgi:Cu+-exporting ATPase
VERALSSVDGVSSAAVNLAVENAVVTWSAGAAVRPDALIQSVESIGYTAKVEDAPEVFFESADHEAVQGSRRTLIFAAALTIPLFVIEMGGHLFPGLHHAVNGFFGGSLVYLLFALATAVQFGPGRIFYQKGWPALMRGGPDMNSLVMLGISAAYLYSAAATFLPAVFPTGMAHVYFEASAVIVTLVLLGRHFEAVARGRTGAALRGLLALQESSAVVIQEGAESIVPIEEVYPDCLLRIRPGGRFPVDGIVVDGTWWVFVSLITGLPLPVYKAVNDSVVAGTVNQRGALVIRATGTGADTLLARIIRMVSEAQGAKLPVQALVDRVTAVFVPVVLGIALLTFCGWLWLGPVPALPLAIVAAVSVLIIACPCAMGLATPTSILVASGRGAELGVLFRNGASIQMLRDVSAVCFDKTGTLTEGRPSVVRVNVAPGLERKEILGFAASIEHASEHPIARAIVDAARVENASIYPVVDFEAVPGLGARARCMEREVLIGSARFLERQNVSGLADGFIAGEGETSVFLALDGALAATFFVADEVKAGAVEVVRMLRLNGLDTVMITGDQASAAKAIAGKLGIVQVISGVLPGEKAGAIRSLQQGGRRIAFVGDGINDAPALAQADVGIAVGTGTDIAIETADVVIMSGDPRAVVDAIRLSRAAMRNIRQNLFFAFVYNAVLIPVAAGVLYPVFGTLLSPTLAAGAMAASSICVVTNALRLRSFRGVRA